MHELELFPLEMLKKKNRYSDSGEGTEPMFKNYIIYELKSFLNKSVLCARTAKIQNSHSNHVKDFH